MASILCPYCGNPARLVNGSEIYKFRKDLAFLKFWKCGPCDSYVGCHKQGAIVQTESGNVVSDGTMPLGRLANAELRKAKSDAHMAFDVFWKYEDNKGKARRDAYKRLARALGIKFTECHIGSFDVAMCKRVLAVCNDMAAEDISSDRENQS